MWRRWIYILSQIPINLKFAWLMNRWSYNTNVNNTRTNVLTWKQLLPVEESQWWIYMLDTGTTDGLWMWWISGSASADIPDSRYDCMATVWDAEGYQNTTHITGILHELQQEELQPFSIVKSSVFTVCLTEWLYFPFTAVAVIECCRPG